MGFISFISSIKDDGSRVAMNHGLFAWDNTDPPNEDEDDDDLGMGDLTLLLGTPLFWFTFFFLSLWNPAVRLRDSSFSVIVFDFLTPLASVEFLTGKPFKLVFDPKIKVFEATVATSSPQGSVLSLKKLKKKLLLFYLLNKMIYLENITSIL